MVKALIQTHRDRIERVELKGHSDYADIGKDIVCAGISSIVIAITNGLTDILDLQSVRAEASSGNFLIEMPESLPEEVESDSQLLLKTLIKALNDIQTQYPEYLEVITKEKSL